MTKSTDIYQYELTETTMAELIEKTGLAADRWQRIMQNGAQFGVRSHVFIIPSEVRWRALLAKYMLHVEDMEGENFINHRHYDGPQLTEEDRQLLTELLEEHREEVPTT